MKYEPYKGALTDPRSLFIHKRQYFDAEKEVRVILNVPSAESDIVKIALPTALSTLVDEIIVAPESREIFLLAVRQAVIKASDDGNPVPVRLSELDKDVLPEAD